MSAIVIIMPVVKRVPAEELGTRMLQITLDRATFRRLQARSRDWNITQEEAAASILGEVLRPKGGRR
jgi:hypothetical protein